MGLVGNENSFLRFVLEMCFGHTRLLRMLECEEGLFVVREDVDVEAGLCIVLEASFSELFSEKWTITAMMWLILEPVAHGLLEVIGPSVHLPMRGL